MTVVRLATAADMAGAYAIRHEVFVVGQAVPAELERDDLDAGAVHAVALSDGQIVGTGRLVVAGPVGIVGRMAVLAAARSGGTGAALLARLERAAVTLGLRSIELHAQVSARGFYARTGYRAVGDVYAEAGIEHITMRKMLPVVRELRDTDGPALIELITACWSAYPGCVMDVDGEEPWLRAPATAYAAMSARGWVVEGADGVLGCVGLRPDAGGGGELKSLYVSASARRQGLGGLLSGLVEDEARARGVRALELWTDTRFIDAHRLYERLGYHRLPDTRDLHDLSNTTEYHYRKDLQ